MLDLDGRAYVEMEITDGHLRDFQARADNSHQTSSARNSHGPNVEDSSVQGIGHYFDDAASPTRIEIQRLPPVVIDGYQCKVYEQRASFLDGHTEVTRIFRARDVGGLALRVEIGGATNEKVITERRDVRTEVSADAFVVPADFKKLDKLDHK